MRRCTYALWTPSHSTAVCAAVLATGAPCTDRSCAGDTFIDDTGNRNITCRPVTGAPRGGSQREGLGRGIHWHIENEVWYLPQDPLHQDIPYVRAIDSEGSITEYYDVASGVTPDDVAGSTLVPWM